MRGDPNSWRRQPAEVRQGREHLLQRHVLAAEDVTPPELTAFGREHVAAGNVIDVRIESSDLKTPELEAKLLARIRQFDFGAKDVNQMVVSYPVDFLPS